MSWTLSLVPKQIERALEIKRSGRRHWNWEKGVAATYLKNRCDENKKKYNVWFPLDF